MGPAELDCTPAPRTDNPEWTFIFNHSLLSGKRKLRGVWECGSGESAGSVEGSVRVGLFGDGAGGLRDFLWRLIVVSYVS